MPKKVTKIYSPEKKGAAPEGASKVAAYCRVSTKSEKQETSYLTQVSVYTHKIESHPGWVLAGIYADHGISGTQAERRPQFLKMVKDCEAGMIDIVLCKSISRFSRNTLDAVSYIRKLKELGVRIIFEKEGIDTGSEYSEMLLTVLAAFAQEESRSHSENVKWGKRTRAMKGSELLIPVYGYQKNADGTNYEIIPEEAKVVRMIFDLYEHGTSAAGIVKKLEEEGIQPAGYASFGNRKWDQSHIYYMIENEKYAGDFTCQRFYSNDYLKHRAYRNSGQIPSKLLTDHHEPIIERHQFERCNKILLMKKKSKPGIQYPFGEYLTCPYCGHVLHRRRLDIQNIDSHFCCEGDGACRKFAIMAIPAEKEILKAYNELDLIAVKRIAQQKNQKRKEEAEKLLLGKEENPELSSIEFWWLDDYVKMIEFGRHYYTASDLAGMPGAVRKSVDDRVIYIHWRCGLVSKIPSGVIRDSHDPKHKAKLWDAYLLRYPDRHPELTDEVIRKQNGR